MATITEDYVSFETAKLLKEKGFPQEYDIFHSMVYNEENYEDEYEVQRMVLETRLVKAGTLSSYPAGVPEPKCYCCTLQMAMKWLRKVHNIHTYTIDTFIGFKYVIQDMFHHDEDIHPIDGICFSSNEEAYEAAIKYCLENLI